MCWLNEKKKNLKKQQSTHQEDQKKMGIGTSRINEIFRWQLATATTIGFAGAFVWKAHVARKQATINDYYRQLRQIEEKEDKIKREQWKKWIAENPDKAELFK
eukprot:TRINITY_DN82671_c0_g1_i1.p1 TRINITY_DN82671_c0_g1~~TRINITY_DN82671_c0_g1_i1.p1  ORF type:complete len:103 (-),score=11.49 TRINITY_DN82671_c0_g1_i1:90-398(-)